MLGQCECHLMVVIVRKHLRVACLRFHAALHPVILTGTLDPPRVQPPNLGLVAATDSLRSDGEWQRGEVESNREGRRRRNLPSERDWLAAVFLAVTSRGIMPPSNIVRISFATPIFIANVQDS